MSTGPVDKVLNNRGGVSKLTHQKILRAIEELGYKPNILASRLKSTKEYTLAIIIPRATEDIPFWSQHQKGLDKIYDELNPFGLRSEVIYFHQNDERSFELAVNKAIHENYDGILIVPVFRSATIKLLQHCKVSAVPVIFFDSYIESEDNLSFVGQHSKDSGYMAADLMHGCIPVKSKILIITIVKKEDNHFHFAAREEGFRMFFENTGRQLIKYELQNENKQVTRRELKKILEEEKNIGGIFVTNGINMVAPVWDQLQKPPVQLIGYDLIEENILYLKKGVIRFLISQQPDKQVYLGIKLLYEYLILKQPVNKSYYIPLDIVMRANVDYYLANE